MRQHLPFITTFWNTPLRLYRAWHGPVYVYHLTEETNLPVWPGAEFHHRRQQGADLGEAMYQSFRDVLQHEPAALIIGTDCPQLSLEHVQQAAGYLQTYPAVLGPAHDGGYYLLGLRDADARLFVEMPWSTDRVAELTRQRFRALNWSWQELPVLADVDTVEDLRAVGWTIPSDDSYRLPE